MSSTNRTPKRPNEFFPTPAWVTTSLLDKQVLPAGNWLEAGAGDGAIIKAANTHPAYGHAVRWTAAELQPAFAPALQLATGRAPIIGDFREIVLPEKPFDVCIANPPFSLAEDFLHIARQHADQVCFLLRLNFLQGGARSKWLTTDCPDVYVLPDRPSFTGDGQTDSIAYAWMLWHGYRRGKRTSGSIEVLASTPGEVRNIKTEKKPRKPRTPKAAKAGEPDAGQGREAVGPPDAEAVRGSGTDPSEAGS